MRGLSNRGDEGRGRSRGPEWGPWRQRKEAPLEIKGPGRNRGSGAALSPMAAIHSSARSAKSSPTITSSGPSGKGGTAPGSVPLAQRDSSGPGHSFPHRRPQDSPTQRWSCPSVWAAPQPDSQPFTSLLSPPCGALGQEARLGPETGDAAPPSQAHMRADAEPDSGRENKEAEPIWNARQSQKHLPPRL